MWKYVYSLAMAIRIAESSIYQNSNANQSDIARHWNSNEMQLMPKINMSLVLLMSKWLCYEFKKESVLSINIINMSAGKNPESYENTNEILSIIYRHHLSGMTIIDSIERVTELALEKANIFAIDSLADMK